jgi:uncharacterized protein (DUF488 family)
MQTEEFQQGISELLNLATGSDPIAKKASLVCIMCAEAVPWRCHRSLIGDALLVRGHQVIDIFDQKKIQPETLTSFAKVKGQTITYPAEASS